MAQYALYTYSYTEADYIQTDCFREKVPFSTEDKNMWFDRLFGDRKDDVRIQKQKNGRVGVDKYPCTVLAHKDRVVWLRMENEKSMRLYVKSHSQTADPDPIEQQNIPTNPFSYIFIDCREGKNMIAIMKNNDAWRSTDVEAKLLEVSLNWKMKEVGYGFNLEVKPETIPKDYWNYNRQLIKKEKKRVKKMVIYFTGGTLDSKVEEIIDRTPYLKRLLRELWGASSGKVELNDPFGREIVDGRKRDIKNIIEIITSNMTDSGFGLSLAYEGGMEVTCGKDVRLEYPMKEDVVDMLFRKDLFGTYGVNHWLDQAGAYIKVQKDETTTDTRRKRKAPKHVRDTSLAIDFA